MFQDKGCTTLRAASGALGRSDIFHWGHFYPLINKTWQPGALDSRLIRFHPDPEVWVDVNAPSSDWHGEHTALGKVSVKFSLRSRCCFQASWRPSWRLNP